MAKKRTSRRRRVPKWRIEQDSMGKMKVPSWALWGASTQRAKDNFPVSGRVVPVEVVHAFGLLKEACARANMELKRISGPKGRTIVRAAQAVAEGELDDHFVVDVFQTGSGTSTNMNANEVIANYASLEAGEEVGSKRPVHPNDHVNMGQSSNDTFPTAMHVAAALSLANDLKPALERMQEELAARAEEWDDITKIGRTHLMDATPIRVGQVFGGYAEQMAKAMERCDVAIEALSELAIGGTAVGTGINTHPQFSKKVCQQLSNATGLTFREANNHPEAQAAKDGYVEVSGELRTIAVSLSKIANDIRWLGSGPRCGLGELSLPATQPGSSIMPGKVNPVICESMIQICARVVGNDTSVTLGGFGGVGSILELNVAMPMMADAVHESIKLLTNGCDMFTDKLLRDLKVNREHTEGLIEGSLMIVTSLAPVIGYDQAAAVAKEAHRKGKTIREIVLALELLDEEQLDELLDFDAMTRPHR
ncbi:MAG TPA: class II fumarate hydratase [Candidatus Krumholzibacteria bacterium]|nr:class II fumarate hydratase [Candidatus Krumholzibacteria bacterium]